MSFFIKKLFICFIYFTVADVNCDVAAVKHLPVLHNSEDNIFSFEIILVTLKIEYA